MKTLKVFADLAERESHERVYDKVVNGIHPIVVSDTLTIPVKSNDNRIEHLHRLLANIQMWTEQGPENMAVTYLRLLAQAATIHADRLESAPSVKGAGAQP